MYFSLSCGVSSDFNFFIAFMFFWNYALSMWYLFSYKIHVLCLEKKLKHVNLQHCFSGENICKSYIDRNKYLEYIKELLQLNNKKNPTTQFKNG